jgi:hypothetical protein
VPALIWVAQAPIKTAGYFSSLAIRLEVSQRPPPIFWTSA